MTNIEKILTAIARNDLAALRKLVTRENVNACDEDGISLLANVILDDETDPRQLKLFIERGADVNGHDQEGYGPLHFAARDQRVEMARLLIEAGAEVNALNADRSTPLCLCTLSPVRNLELVRLLLAHGADPRKKNRDGDSPLVSAKFAEDHELLALLKERPTIGSQSAAAKRVAKPKAAAKPKSKAGEKKSAKASQPQWVRRYHELRKKLVPRRGPADSLQGELIRLVGRLCDEAFRNGNANWSQEYSRAWKFLGKSLADAKVFSPEELAEIKRHVSSIVRDHSVIPARVQGSPYDELCHKTVEWCDAQPKRNSFAPKKSTYSF